MFSTGLWRGELARRFPAANGIRYFIPPVMVLGVLLGLLAGIGGIMQAMAGATPWLLVGLADPRGVRCSSSSSRRSSPLEAHGASSAAWFLVVLPCIHFSWGVGFVLGYL